jgi:signal transduction histidine kinase
MANKKLLEAAEIGTWHWDISKNKMTLDDEMQHVFGLKPKTFSGKFEDFIHLLHPDDKNRVLTEMKAASKNKKPFETHFRVISKDKSIRYITTRGNIPEKDRSHIRTGVCWDMTHEHKDEDSLRQAKEASDISSWRKSERLARITHDLRTPLNGIIGFAEILYSDKLGPVSESHKEYLGDILTSARHLLILINDLMDIAKAETGKMEFIPEQVDIEILMSETMRLFHAFAAQKNITLSVEIDPSLKKIIIDPSRLKQVIYNYVSNAIKCTPDNGKVNIYFKPENKENFRLEVSDTGIGIRKEDMNKLFIEFQQLDRETAKKYPSSGLGLALTRHLVEAQKGEVGATSTFGKGSTFYAILPRVSRA